MRVRTHPGEILLKEFLKPMYITPHALAIALGVPATSIADIVHQRRAVTADTAPNCPATSAQSPTSGSTFSLPMTSLLPSGIRQRNSKSVHHKFTKNPPHCRGILCFWPPATDKAGSIPPCIG